MIKAKRAKPLLGTFVEITAYGYVRDDLIDAITHAFTAIQKVQSLMSRFDPESDVSKLNKSALNMPTSVHSWTYEVISVSKLLFSESGGIFDITAPARATVHSNMSATTRDIHLLEKNFILFQNPLALDLGGIAKGYAVDRAVDTLKHFGATAGVVNAGGDIAVFGADPFPIHIRRPDAPDETLKIISLKNGALATSGGYFFGIRNFHFGILDARYNQPWRSCSSATVIADSCFIADALTKVVAVSGRSSLPLLRRLKAEALVVSPEDTGYSLERFPNLRASKKITFTFAHKQILFLTLFLVWISGLLWIYLDIIKHERTPLLLREFHGAAALAMLILVGSLLDHVRQAWKTKGNRKSGISLIVLFSIITITGWMLYYVGSDELRNCTSLVHWILGLVLPALVGFHGFRARYFRS